MSQPVIDKIGCQIWYDLKSDVCDNDNNIGWDIENYNQSIFYVRPHREDGPVVIWLTGVEVYYIEGKCHREDGPAIIYPQGIIEWYLNGEDYLFEEWCEKLNKTDEEINFFKLKWNIQ